MSAPSAFHFETSPHVSTIDVAPFQSAYARLCDLSARALSEGASRAEVLEAFEGRGDAPGLEHIRTASKHTTHRTALVRHNAMRQGHGEHAIVSELVKAGRRVRDAAEAEWMVMLPIVNPNP